MRPWPVVILLAVVIGFAALIGFRLTAQRPLSLADATKICQEQVPGGTVQELAACIRAKQFPRATPTSRLVVLLPLGLGSVALGLIVFYARRRPGGERCPECGHEGVKGDDTCVHCGAPLPTG